jgi:hypothetical protein
MTELADSAGSLTRRINVEEFFPDPAFAGASISPVGTRVAHRAPARGCVNVWIRGIDGEHGHLGGRSA